MTCVSSSLSVLAHSTPVHLSPGNSWEIHFPPSRASPPPSPLARPRPGTGPAARSRSTAPDLSHAAAAPDARARCRQSCVTGAGRGGGEESLKSPDSQLCRTRQAGRPQTDRQTDARAPDAGKPGSLNPRAFGASSSSLLPFPASTDPSLPGTLIPWTVSAAPLFNPSSWCLAVAGGTMRPELPVTATHSATPKTLSVHRCY